jgi:hypothetical protein
MLSGARSRCSRVSSSSRSQSAGLLAADLLQQLMSKDQGCALFAVVSCFGGFGLWSRAIGIAGEPALMQAQQQQQQQLVVAQGPTAAESLLQLLSRHQVCVLGHTLAPLHVKSMLTRTHTWCLVF